MSETDPVRPARNSGIAALVLAAGASQRMGSPKQLLRLGEKTLLEHVLDAVRGANVDEIVLVLGADAAEIQGTVSTGGLVVVMNESYQQGMGSSLRRGLAAVNAKAEGVLVILADQPFVRTATLNSLIEYHRSHNTQIIIPMYKGFRGNPVLVDRSVFPELMKLQGEIGCRAIFGSHTENIQKVPVDDPGILQDMDTLADFRSMAALLDLQEEARATLSANAEIEERPVPSTSTETPELVIVGRDALAAALVRFARVLGFTITLVDPFLTLAEQPEADRILHRLDFCLLPENDHRYIVVASRGQFDEEALEQALVYDHRYITLVAGKARREELIQILMKRGFGEAALDRLRAPAGLEIGAETPEEIALSIMAEVVAVRHNSTTETRRHGEKRNQK